jgi:NDP-sugar pyrophosphorylase family protein
MVKKTNNRPQIIIPMSGFGSRFLKEGYLGPKPLVQVLGFPMIKHVLDIFPNSENVVFVCNKQHLENTQMRQVLLDLSPSCKIVSIEPHKKGPVYAVLEASQFVLDDRPVIVSYCDYGTEWDYELFLNTMEQTNSDGGIPCYIGFHPHMLGKDHYAYVREENKTAIEVREKKPFTDNKMSEFASNGTYYFKSGYLLKYYFNKLIEDNKHMNGEFYVSMVYNQMIKDKLKVKIFEIEKMLQWGTPYDLRIYQKWMRYFINKNRVPIRPFSAPKDTTLLLPMAGRGHRFKTEGFEEPKPFIKVDGVPMFYRAIQDLPRCESVVLGILKEHTEKHYYKQRIQKQLKNSKIVEIDSVTQGQACTVEIMIKEQNLDPERPILVSACDNGIYYDQKSFEAELNDLKNDIVVCSFRNHETSKNNPNMYAWLDVDDEGFIKHVSCKNFIYDDPLKTHAIIGTMFFRKARFFLDGLQKNYENDIRTNGEFYVDDVLNQNIEMGLRVKVFEAKDFICWGTPNDYKTYNYWKDHFEKNRF